MPSLFCIDVNKINMFHTMPSSCLNKSFFLSIVKQDKNIFGYKGSGLLTRLINIMCPICLILVLKNGYTGI